MITDSIGLYVHIPFCLKKCAYCDFSSYSGVSGTIRAEYVEALCKEICSYGNKVLSVDTVFFGGGTPSLLSLDELGRIFDAIKQSFFLHPSAEISLEANPGTLDDKKLYGYKSLGINRLSIGCQSLCDGELAELGRIHTANDFYKAYSMARDAGFSNINVDIMYGIPSQTMESFEYTLDEILRLSPEHISMYGLILEPGTAFWDAKESLPLPTEDTECDMYYHAAKLLSRAGYSHYEISNYAKTGYECAHNLKYWRCEDYLGVGLAAHSFLDKKRFFNPTTFDKYFSSFGADYISDEASEESDFEYEYAMMRLRLKEGILLSEYKNTFGKSFTDGREERLALYEKLGYIKLDGDRLALTESGFYVSNSILSELL